MHSSHLKLYIMHALKEGPLSGYDIMKAVEGQTGRRPSSGSVYPLLDALKKGGLISVSKHGKKQLNRLTLIGLRHANELTETRHGLFEHLIQDMSMLTNTLVEKEIAGYITEMLRRMQQGEDPLGPAEREILTLRKTLLAIILRKDFKSRALKVKKILNHCTQELKTI
ncbi:MAG: PadR family transcriptional regulator [Nanoarchaeota archaeon]